jgi:hypothetical protein
MTNYGNAHGSACILFLVPLRTWKRGYDFDDPSSDTKLVHLVLGLQETTSGGRELQHSSASALASQVQTCDASRSDSDRVIAEMS